MCTDVYGPKFNLELLEDGIKVGRQGPVVLCGHSSVVLQATNTEYGGQDVDLTNVVFVHGSIDPWHAMGITNSSSESAPAIYIEGC